MEKKKYRIDFHFKHDLPNMTHRNTLWATSMKQAKRIVKDNYTKAIIDEVKLI